MFNVNRLRRKAEDIEIKILPPRGEFPYVFNRDIKVFPQEFSSRRGEDRARAAVFRLRGDLNGSAPDRPLTVDLHQLPDVILGFLQKRVVMAPLFGMNHALFEIEQLRRRDLNALDADRRTMAVWPQIAGENVAEKIPLHDLVVLEARRKTVLTLELRIGLRVIPAGIDGVGLANITPAVAGLRSDMLGEKITPLGIHLEVRAGIASGANGGFQLVTAAMTEPAG